MLKMKLRKATPIASVPLDQVWDLTTPPIAKQDCFMYALTTTLADGSKHGFFEEFTTLQECITSLHQYWKQTGTYHKHDCAACIYLGSDTTTETDYYICLAETFSGISLIARYSGSGPDYTSGLCFYAMNPHINRAGNLALEKGLLTLDDINKHSNADPITEPVVL